MWVVGSGQDAMLSHPHLIKYLILPDILKMQRTGMGF